MSIIKDSHMVRYGETDLYVSRICQGTAFSNMPRSVDNEQGLRTLQHCIEVGLNFFDTAAGYGTGGSERLLGRAIAGHRDEVVIANRVLPNAVTLDANEGDLLEPAKFTRDYIFRSTEWSLKRLNTDYLDILSVHLKDGLDPKPGPPEFQLGGGHTDDAVREIYMRLYKDPFPTPSEEIVDSMNALVQSGKIRYWGLSQHNSEEVSDYLRIAEETGKIPIASLQNNYSILSQGRMAEELLPVMKEANLGVQTIGPHGSGAAVKGNESELDPKRYMIVKALDRVATDLGVTRAQVCVAWVLSHPELTTALSGAESPEHVEDNMAGAALELPEEALNILKSASETYRSSRGGL